MITTYSLTTLHKKTPFLFVLLVSCVLLCSACTKDVDGDQVDTSATEENTHGESVVHADAPEADNLYTFGSVKAQWGDEQIEWTQSEGREMAVSDNVVGIALKEGRGDGYSSVFLLGITGETNIGNISSPTSFATNYDGGTGGVSVSLSLGSELEQLHLQTGTITIHQLDLENGTCNGEFKGMGGKMIIGDVESLKNFGEGKNLRPLSGSFHLKIDNVVDVRTKK